MEAKIKIVLTKDIQIIDIEGVNKEIISQIASMFIDHQELIPIFEIALQMTKFYNQEQSEN